MITWLHDDAPFPPVERAQDGLLAAGGSLSVARLMSAYQRGIFPWFNEGQPILWWSPDPRMILLPSAFKISKSLHKTLRHKHYEIRTDSAFEQVMRACAQPRRSQTGTQSGSWIHEDMIAAYLQLHHMGIAHSVETWINDKLVGGVYGIAIGRMFFGESMFSTVTDSSKIALAHLTAKLQRWHYGMIDCQMNTPHLASLGAYEITREEFMQRLQELVNYPSPFEKWRFDDGLIG